jgi:hypothetical protein
VAKKANKVRKTKRVRKRKREREGKFCSAVEEEAEEEEEEEEEVNGHWPVNWTLFCVSTYLFISFLILDL